MATSRLSVLFGLALLAGLTSAPALAQVPPTAPPQQGWHHPRPNLLTTLESLNLTATQQQQVRALMHKYRPQIIHQVQAVHQAEDQLMVLTKANRANNVLQQQFQALQQQRQQLESLHFSSLLALRQVLTPEQWQQLLQDLHPHPWHHRPPQPNSDQQPGPDQPPTP